MSTRIVGWLRPLSAAAVLGLCVSQANAQNADALSVVVDQNGEIYRVNYLCEFRDECEQTIERLTPVKVKQASAVALGVNGARNYLLVGNTGNRSGIKLFVDDPSGGFWSASDFSGVGTTAMVIARNTGTLHVARGSAIEGYLRDGPATAPRGGYAAAPVAAASVGELTFANGVRCQEIVSLEEYPARSGNLLAFCGNPAGILQVVFGGAAATVSTVLPPGALGTSLSSGAVTSVPVPVATPNGDGLLDYALLNTGKFGVAALDLEQGGLRKNLVKGSGKLRSNATGLCNFTEPGNDVDNDEDVDGPCLVFTQPGSTGAVTLAELEYVNGTLVATVREQVDEVLKNPFGIDFLNSGTVPAEDCLAPGCQIANNRLVLNPFFADYDDILISFDTLGPFVDPRYIGDDGAGNPRCSKVELMLDFTNVPFLENFSVGPEFCARDGFFFIDRITDDGELGQPVQGISTWETPGSCWEPGPLPFVSLDAVEYGILSPDAFDVLSRDGTDSPDFEGLGSYVNNRFVQDRLIGCATRVRAGNRLTFVIEDLFGNSLDHQIGDAGHPIDEDTTLFLYGVREFDETFEILLEAPQSGCSEDPLSAPCLDFAEATAQASFGWRIQRSSGLAERELISLTGAESGSVSAKSFLSIENVSINLTAEGGAGTLARKTVSGTTAVGVSGGIADNELSQNGNEAITADFSTEVGEFTVTDLPMVIKSFDAAFLYDGQFGDIQEELIVTATTAEGAELVGRLRAVGSSALWYFDGGAVAASVQNGPGGVIRTPAYPFGDDTLVTALRFEASNKGCGSGGCDGSILKIEPEIPERIANLALAYNGLLKALCPVALRPDYDPMVAEPSRPALCGTGNGPFPQAFNVPPANTTSPHNIQGELQATTEALARFVSHNICQLDFDTDVDPGGIGFGGGETFCTTPPEWSVRPTPP